MKNICDKMIKCKISSPMKVCFQKKCFISKFSDGKEKEKEEKFSDGSH